MGLVGSCLGSCLAQCGCSCLSKACGGCRSRSGSLFPYMALFVVSTIVALILRYWGHPLLVNLYIYHLHFCTTDECLGDGGVNRISFALFLFFGLHALLAKFISSCSRIDTQSWFTKLLLYTTFLVCAWLIPNDFYSVYMNIARVVSAFFLLLQLVILIDFAYQWNESWTSDERPWQKGVVAVSIVLLLGSLAWFIVDLYLFGGGDCHLQTAFIALTFVLTFLTVGLSVSNVLPDGGGLLPASVVTIYSYWLLFTALTSDPSHCNTISSRSREFVPLIIGLLLTAASVAYASWQVATSATLFTGPEGETLNSASSSAAPDVERQVAAHHDDDDDHEEHEEPVDSAASLERARLSARFHAMMACASMYVCMLLTGWGSEDSGDGVTVQLNSFSMWVKICSQWACIGLYVWTLIAPLVCKNRDFD